MGPKIKSKVKPVKAICWKSLYDQPANPVGCHSVVTALSRAPANLPGAVSDNATAWVIPSHLWNTGGRIKLLFHSAFWQICLSQAYFNALTAESRSLLEGCSKHQLLFATLFWRTFYRTEGFRSHVINLCSVCKHVHRLLQVKEEGMVLSWSW